MSCPAFNQASSFSTCLKLDSGKARIHLVLLEKDLILPVSVEADSDAMLDLCRQVRHGGHRRLQQVGSVLKD